MPLQMALDTPFTTYPTVYIRIQEINIDIDRRVVKIAVRWWARAADRTAGRRPLDAMPEHFSFEGPAIIALFQNQPVLPAAYAALKTLPLFENAQDVA